MTPLQIALLCGLVFGTFAVVLMLPMAFPDKRTALLCAFASRFAIGFLIPLISLPVHVAVKGAVVGFLISLPDALLTKAYAPILGIGVVGGAVIGMAANTF
ncbi:MAG: hypothetical protein V4463_06390 [Pseudomonadota bacterium]